MNDRFLIEVIHGGHETILEFLFRFDADVTRHRASELGEEALDEIEPRALRGREVNWKRPAGCLASQALVSLEMCAE